MAWQAATYKPSDALSEAKAMIKSMPLDTADSGNLQYKLVDQACSLVWAAAPWWWTLGVMANISVVAATTDYAVTVPNDFLYLGRTVLQSGSDTQTDLEVVSILPSTITQVGVPSEVAIVSIAAYPVPDTLRVSPKPPTSYTGTLNLTYKRQPPKIVAGNFSSAGAMVLPDLYYPVIQAGVRYLAYLYADDNRAGTATVDQDGKTQYTQALGIFQAAIGEMRRSEKLFLRFPGVPASHG